MKELDKNKYLGKGCRHGHVNEQGLSLRYSSSARCVECEKNYRKEYRGQEYLDYQRKYHQDLRANHPEKLIEYRNTQVARGHFDYRKRKQLTDAAPTTTAQQDHELGVSHSKEQL